MMLPHANAYWVTPGRVLAGEYPGSHDREEAREKVRAHLEAGVRTFIDLTEEGELVPYADLLAEEAARLDVRATHVRVAIRDQDVPESPEVMVRVLRAIETAAEEAPVVYVHCWGGIGRTGTVVGCLLRERGLSGDAALADVARLFATTAKAPYRHESPETEEQVRYVREWTR